MNKLFEITIEIIFWFLIFLSPVIATILLSAIIYFYVWSNPIFTIVIMALGIITGIWWAERIRRKFGCTRYMGKILATPDIGPDEAKKD